jgi:hypothetical protein
MVRLKGGDFKRGNVTAAPGKTRAARIDPQ